LREEEHQLLMEKALGRLGIEKVGRDAIFRKRKESQKKPSSRKEGGSED